MEKTMKTLPADLIKSFDEGLQMLKDQVKDFENPESEMLAIMVDGEAYNYKAACQQYETNTAAWEKEFPADHLQMVKARLEMFLNTTADVDFKAVLKEDITCRSLSIQRTNESLLSGKWHSEVGSL